MRLLGNDFWDDIVDINDKQKKRNAPASPPPNSQGRSVQEMNKGGVSGLTIFYRVLGTFLLVATMVKSWFWSAALFDWALMIAGLALIGLHRRFGAEYAIDRVKPAFLDLHNRLKEVEANLSLHGRGDDRTTSQE